MVPVRAAGVLAGPAAGVPVPARPARHPAGRRAAEQAARHPLATLAAAAVPVIVTEAVFGPDDSTGGWERLAYVFPFLYGFLIASDARFESALSRARWPALAAAAAATVGLLGWTVPAGPGIVAGAGPGWSALQGLAGWALLAAIAGVRRRVHRPPPDQHPNATARPSDAVNAEILLRLRRTTRSIPSSTVIAGHLAIRPCFINPHTQLADVDALADHVTTIGDKLTGTQPG